MSHTKNFEEASFQTEEFMTEFFLYMPSGELCVVKCDRLVLVKKQAGQITECRMTCQLDGNTYQLLNSQRLFRYDPDTFGSIPSEAFVTELPINLSLLLAAESLPLLEEQVSTVEQVAAYLQSLSDLEPAHSLLSTENWLLLSIEQEQHQGVVKHRTVWDYLDWSAISSDDSQEELDDLLLGAIANFLKDTTLRHLAHDTANGEVNPELIAASTQLIETLFTVAPSLFSDDKAAKASFVNAIADLFTELLRSQLTEYLENALAEDTVELPNQQLSETAIAPQPTSVNTIFETAVRFFQAENWIVNQLSDQPILHLNFAGANGQWECYAQAREIQQQFIFYSVLPVKVPEPKRQAIAEYITRANYGITIGNFEFDFSDGEIRYKTSISVEGSQLDLLLVQQLVYSNLLNVDKYLSGFLQVISGDVSPSEAIAQIEV